MRLYGIVSSLALAAVTCAGCASKPAGAGGDGSAPAEAALSQAPDLANAADTSIDAVSDTTGDTMGPFKPPAPSCTQPTLIWSMSGVAIQDPVLVGRGNGGLFAAFRTNPILGSATKNAIWAMNRYKGSTKWSGPTLLSEPTVDSIAPQVAMDNAGDATVLWCQQGQPDTVWGASFSATQNKWSSRSLVYTVTETDSFRCSRRALAMNEVGQARLVWEHHLSLDSAALVTKRYDRQTGSWGGQETIVKNTANPGQGLLPMTFASAVDKQGNAMVAWGVAGDLYASRYDVSQDGWTSPTSIEAADPPAVLWPTSYGRTLGFHGTGDALVVWSQDGKTSTGPGQVLINRFNVTTGQWTGAIAIGSFQQPSYVAPQLAVSPAGNAIVSWTEYSGGSRSIWASYYSKQQQSWSTPQSLVTACDVVATSLIVRSGQAVVARGERNGAKLSVSIGRYHEPSGAWSSSTTVVGLSQPVEHTLAAGVDETIAMLLVDHQASSGSHVYRLWSVSCQ